MAELKDLFVSISGSADGTTFKELEITSDARSSAAAIRDAAGSFAERLAKLDICSTCVFEGTNDWVCPECLICKIYSPQQARSMYTTREEYDNTIAMTQNRPAKVTTSPEFNKLCNKIKKKYKK